MEPPRERAAKREPERPAAVFAAAIGDYARVLQGQLGAVTALCNASADHRIRTIGELLADLDALREAAGHAPPEDGGALAGKVLDYAASAEARLLTLVAEGQVQDKTAQMLAGIAEMAGAIGTLDLDALSASPEAAALPRRIVETAHAGFVMAEQRLAFAPTLRGAGQDGGPTAELF
ncbi:2OG-Fe(II) oxygenase family protein [Rhodovulum strictum]|uniref:Uncharacterized protein n=1 Tax=Rhodovulum strictum TaxID=58314 RepID=A0A844BME7_9RHOB|nr:hypothetical protein [Rhodovulum strictum]MRH22123.1 hypothetical protein [Rhodovulum strictum]